MEQLFRLSHHCETSLQQQLREQIAAAILDGYIRPERALPSSRKLSEQLGIGRNTVVLAYEHLVEDGYLISRERSGYFVNPEVFEGAAGAAPRTQPGDEAAAAPNWDRWLRAHPSRQRNISKPADWQRFEYCFIYGQLDPALFPTRNWRECWRDAVSLQAIKDWSVDRFDGDDPLLVEQIRTRLLPRRGVRADAQQILVTVGAQHALYLAMRLLLGARRTLGMENPGYVDARNIAALNPARIAPLAVDDAGLVPDERQLSECDCVYVTPSHQSPTTVTMPFERRRALLDLAQKHDFLVLEDDYESETSFANKPEPALKSLDDAGRVIYVGSLSKTLAPGLRLGYLVGPVEFIREARALRRLMLRHPAANNQRAVALFLARGYHDSLVRSLVRAYRLRWEVMTHALQRHLPDSSRAPSFGGSSFWVRGPERLDARRLAECAAAESILIEPGDIHFLDAHPPLNCFRLGYSSISEHRIEPGVRRLAELIAEML